MTNALRDEIAVGWTVEIIDHHYINDSRDDVTVEAITPDGLTLRPKKAWGSQGRKFATMHMTWDGDLEIDGRTVRWYRTATGLTSRSKPGERQLIKTYRFEPPR